MYLKLGRHEYIITNKDIFMDNGACIQLLSQSKEKRISAWTIKKPVLSKKAIKKISKYARKPIKHSYGNNVSVFSLDIN